MIGIPKLSDNKSSQQFSGWSWVPSLYFAQGIPYVLVNTVSVILYTKLGVSNAEIAFYTSWLYLPWVIKPLWSPIVELYKNNRYWIVLLQFITGLFILCAAYAIQLPIFLQLTLSIFLIVAFSSATHDIAADGFYIQSLEHSKQAQFLGIRSTFFRAAMIVGQGVLVMLAGYLEVKFQGVPGGIAHAWSVTFAAIGSVYILFSIYHYFALPKVNPNHFDSNNLKDIVAGFINTFRSFFKKPGIQTAILFLLIYRFGEAQLVKLAAPFLLDKRIAGGLELTTSEFGFAYGTVGILALTIGGILGGVYSSKRNFRQVIFLMFLSINIPHILYILLAYLQPTNLYVINAFIAMEQFGYGFGFTAYLLYMIQLSDGEHQTAHYAICTGFMALSMMIPGLFSGWLQSQLGYKLFFVWVLVTMLPGYFIVREIKK